MRAHLALFLTSVLFAANFSIAKIAMPEWVPPFAFISIRVVPTALVFWLLHRFTVREPIRSRRDLGKMLLGALLGIAGNMLLIFKGLSLTAPINASLLTILSPIVVLVGSSFLIGEPMTRRKMLGTLLAAGGTVLLVVNSRSAETTGSLEGDLLVLVSAVSYGGYLILTRPLAQRYHPFTIMKWNFLFGVLLVVPFGIVPLQQIQWSQFPAEVWGSVVFVVIGVTILPYLFNAVALRTVSASVAGIYIYLQPPMAAWFAVMLGKDQLTWTKIGLGLLILLGVFIASRPRLPQPRAKVLNES
ncbi:Permease of the drug/metabolite transporter (DMT) superfamily [Catalinimonas alkaloidigena]|uniref:Permease of the drug/metabolite transporter (DMT) superfamily n=1 Tax=Catalinimonas alkaloidigena TaxID=1075417 RepID=A0A1G9C1Q2_9BACT|nr:Permease of the drug/metabolite transporter (DMT) superfamily [Catalinimonas alkaloidigena]